ncbi:MAG: TerC family protein [Bacteroidota bacterium]|jgi:tellurite resistance protein TerC
MTDIVPSSFWIYFNLSILALLGLDLFFVNRKNKAVSVQSTLGWVVFWIFVALLFGVWIYNYIGSNAATEYLTAYLIEWTLSVDNLFVFIIVFNYFKVPDEYQHRVLFWGILGALVLRGVFISAGVTLIHHFEWLVYLFGGFLVFTGIKIFFHKEDDETDLSKNIIVRFMRKFVPLSDEYDGNRFFTKRNAKLIATPLFLVLIVIEFTDLIFAVDSIPASLSISKNAFIIYCSNVLAVLGLRSLYFGISHLMKIFKYLKFGIAIILVFVGIKMLIAEFFHLPPLFALGTIITILFVSVLFSLRANSNKA